MKKNWVVLIFIVFVLSACKREIAQLNNSNSLLSFNFNPGINQSLAATTSLNCTITDTLVTGTTETAIDRSALVATFTISGGIVTINNVVQESGITKNDFTKPVIYTVTSQDGIKKEYTVKLTSFTGLPIFYITTEAPVESEVDYVNGTLKIDGNMQFTDGLYDGSIQIRGRGNSTWYAEKKPYKIKLNDKTSILGMPADKEWALLANYYDKSLLRNDVAFEFSEQLNLAWTPRRRFVEVFLNGQYNGNYLLTETVKQSNDRVNIDTKNGGYLLEVDYHPDDEDPGFHFGDANTQLPTYVKEGTVSTADLKKTLDSFYAKIANAQFDPNTGYQAGFDLDAFVGWYLVNEIMLNNDAIFYSSVYLEKKNTTSKLQMGPVWDFDLSSGNVNYGQTNPEGWYLKQGPVISSIWNDPAFQAAVKSKWNQYRSQLLSIPEYINNKQIYLKLSANENFKRWDILNTTLPNTVVVPGSYDGEVAYLRDWLNKRLVWMDAEINK